MTVVGNSSLPLVVLAVPDSVAAASMEEALGGSEFRTSRALGISELTRVYRESTPDLIVAELTDGLSVSALTELTHDRRTPLVFVTSGGVGDLLSRTGSLAVEAVLTMPASPEDLRAAVTLAVRHTARQSALRAEVAELRQRLEDRKLIERAKGIVTRRIGVGEADAFARMRSLSSRKNLKMVELARAIVECDTIFAELDRSGGRAFAPTLAHAPPRVSAEV